MLGAPKFVSQTENTRVKKQNMCKILNLLEKNKIQEETNKNAHISAL
jgi:hypothetical protein